MIKIKRAIDLFRLDKFQLIKKINTLELENSVLEQTIKDELYKIFMDKLREPQELDRVKKENKKPTVFSGRRSVNFNLCFLLLPIPSYGVLWTRFSF